VRYHWEKPGVYASRYGVEYYCDHPVYNRCTLYKIGDRGLAVVQQRHDEVAKTTWWDRIDPWMTDPIYLNPGFWPYFDERAKAADDHGFYPTVSIRQIMWALKMKPMKKERWETVFDRKLL
jgi:hypothetical protein